MKSKKIKKMAKLIHEEFRNYERESRPMKISEEISGGDWSEYDSEVSEKFKKMVLNLATYKNNIHINIDSGRVSISTNDITSVKNTRRNQNVPYSEENYVEMSLHKGLGFSINYGYRLRTNYKDEKLFDEIQPILVQKLKQINADNFNEIWTELMRESGVLRDNNLDDILNG
jgi:predicted DNA binding CopG/RHH family protein